MTEPPTLDDRSQEELLAELTELADQYVDGWESSSDDTASVLLRIVSEFGRETIQRLNGLPDKHRAAFLDSLGFQRRPPQAARLPLSVAVSTDLDRNVAIPSGTQAVATTPTDETELFEVPQGNGFEATPASLTESYTVDPDADRLVSHADLIDGDSEQLFAGDNRQQHAIYLGDDSLLTLDPGSTIEIEFRGSADPQALEDSVCWEYYGIDDEGSEGWHSLPVVEPPEPPLGADDSRRSHRLDRGLTAPQSTGEAYSVHVRLPNELVSTAVDGIDSRWLRCRLVESTPACFATEIESIHARVDQSTESNQITPDAGFANDVPLTFDEDTTIRPFGRYPQPSSTIYLAASETLTKPGAIVTLSFASLADEGSPPSEPVVDDAVDGDSSAMREVDFGALSGPPEVSWEYWNGTGWVGLSVQSDDTDNLRTGGELQFSVPEDIAETAVSGHEARWIRGRLVSGRYGESSVDVTDPDSSGVPQSNSPAYRSISLQYEHTETTFSNLVSQNNAVCETVPETVDRWQPFRRLPEASQTIYFGFDDVLRDGPIPIFLPLVETSYPQGFDPGVQWEYCTDPEGDSWSRLPVEDGTAGLTERGIVSLRLPEPTTAHERFGTRCHWIRAVVTEDTFATANAMATENGGDQSTGPASSMAEAPEPPVVAGIYPNTQWADNARTIERELLGSSDGSASQQFACAHVPLIDCEVWVDEAGSLSAAERAGLREEMPDGVEAVTDDHGDLTEFWVRWTPVDEFLGVDSDRRVYRCDRSAGTVTFGDGDGGKIPPREQDSIRATYTTGGGRGGNVEAGAVADLKTPISLVESVDNPLPADGGAGVESMDEVASRAASEIKTRGKAVTAEDFERVAATAVRKLAAVDCQPHLGPDGNPRSGWITLLIVPDRSRERPMPSRELEQRVHRAVSEAAPATLTAGGQSRITVRGPNYAAVSVDVTVQTTGVASISGLKTEIESTLESYLHPLTGGPKGTGWAFGEPPTADALESLFTSIADVEAVTELSATVQIGDETVQLAQGPSSPTLPSDGLVCTGSHEIAVQVGGQRLASRFRSWMIRATRNW